jgi:hypothetical protein
MNKSWSCLLVLAFALPVYAQDPAATPPPADANTPPPADSTAAPPADANTPPPADASAPAAAPAPDAAAAPAAPAETPPADAGAAPASPAPEAAPTETAAAPAAAEPGTPWKLYGGVDWVRDTLSASALSGYNTSTYDTGMYRVRAGARVFDAIGVEGHFGIDRSDKRTDTAKTCL